MHHSHAWLLAPTALLFACAGSAGERLTVGREEPTDAAEYAMGGSGGATSTLDAGDPPDGTAIAVGPLAVEVRNLGCNDTCVRVEAVASGGTPPYVFQWHDGTGDATRELCPEDDTLPYVTVTDATPTDGEFAADNPGVAQAPASLGACAGTEGCAGDTSLTPAPGRYVGTYVCMAGQDVVPSGTFVVEIGPDAAQPSGDLWIQWDLFVIGGDGTLAGDLDCDTGAFRALWSGLWGLPGAADASDMRNPPFTLLPLGTASGQLVLAASPGDPDELTGSFEWVAPPVVPGDDPSQCIDGTFSARREGG